MAKTAPLKTCGECRRALPLDAFQRHRGHRDGRQHACRQCYLTIRKRYDDNYQPKGNTMPNYDYEEDDDERYEDEEQATSNDTRVELALRADGRWAVKVTGTDALDVVHVAKRAYEEGRMRGLAMVQRYKSP